MVNKVYRELPDLVWESPNRVEGKAVDSCLILSRYRDNLFYARKLMSDGSYILRLYDIDNFVEFAVPSHRDWANTQVPLLFRGIKSNTGLPVGIKKSKKGSYQVRLTYNGTNVCNTFNSLENAAAYRSELEHNLIYHGNVYGKD